MKYDKDLSFPRYLHWNHPYLKNWDKRDRRKYPRGSHDPINNDVGSNFFPQCGIYSSRDPAIIQQHMQQARLSGAGTLVGHRSEYIFGNR